MGALSHVILPHKKPVHTHTKSVGEVGCDPTCQVAMLPVMAGKYPARQERTVPTKIKCDRCRQPFRDNARDADQWNVTMRRGVAVGYLCPRCQTPEETAEAVINEATLDYGRDQFGRVLGRAKAGV